MAKTGMSLEEMREIVSLDAEFSYHYWQSQQAAWEREDRAKAAEIIALIRQHIPADRLQEVENFLRTQQDYLAEAI